MKNKKISKKEELLLEIKKLELEIKLEEIKNKLAISGSNEPIKIKVIDINNIKDPKFY